RISVGITHSASSTIIPEVLATYSAKKEDVTINILVDDINIIYTNLKNYKIDLAIIDGITTSEKINSILLDTDYLVCIVPNSSPLAKKPVIQIDEIKREKLILRSPSSGTRNLFEAAIENRNMSLAEFNLILQVDSVSTIKNLVAKNIGISILPHSACVKDIEQGALTALPIENLSMIRETRIAYLKDFAHFDIIQDIKALYNSMNSVKQK
ncbi:MAG: LysR substrate-binding domain-containing protein, partial [Clostridia bacterium]